MEREYGYYLEQVDPAGVAPQWDTLAANSVSPFLTTAWLVPWSQAYARDPVWLGLWDADANLRAGACFLRARDGTLLAAANVETSSWDVIASEPKDREAMWRAVVELGSRRLQIRIMPEHGGVEVVRHVLQAAGYRLIERTKSENPRLQLPSSWDDLLAAVSPNLRSQYRRRLRALSHEGPVRLRTTSGGTDLARDFQTFLRLEASGWKGRRGTAMLYNPQALTLYRGFAERAAQQGWLRLQLLEVGGRAVAGDLSCVFAGGTFMLKTAYDEALGDFSPGLVLRGEALRTAIDEGSAFFDFLGSPESYKMRWGAQAQRYLDIDGYRGAYAPVAFYHRRIRPVVGAARRQLRSRRSSRALGLAGPGADSDLSGRHC